MDHFLRNGAVALLLVVQAAISVMPQVPWPCLTSVERCPCVPAQDACCAAGQNTVPVAPIECGCNRDRVPTALVSAKSATIGLPDQSAIVATLVVAEPSMAAARWQSIDTRRAHVPDIPVRILFCTWLE